MRTIAIVFSGWLIFAAGLSAQTAQPTPAPSTSPSSTEQQYGLNLSRIQRGLQRSAERQDYDGLNLRYYVNVYAPAPSIQLYSKQDNLAFAPAPYGGPTHREVMDLITPREYRAPVADFSGIARWLANRAKK
jgi:hypothetical protein